MNLAAADRLPSLEQVADRSADFQERFERLDTSEGPHVEVDVLVVEVEDWLQDCLAYGQYVAPGTADRRALKGIVDGWRSRLRRLGRAVKVSDELLPFDCNAGVPLLGPCPYPGLEPYTPDRASSFFGRDSLVSVCVERIEDPGRRVVLLIGASGSGKSSVALAGVRPILQERHRDSWIFAKWMSPGQNPLRAMAMAILGCDAAESDLLASALATQPARAPEICSEATDGRPLFLIVDQLEELFTLSRDSSKRKSFVDCVCALVAADASVGNFQCHILFTLRTDQLANFEHDDELTALHRLLIGRDNYFSLAAVDQKDIYRAIAEPANAVGLRFVPPSLIAILTAQTAGLANGLPLLQFALTRLWDIRPRDDQNRPLDLINEEMVATLPDVKGALGKIADEIVDSFGAEADDPHRRICERMLLELVVLDENYEEPLRRRRLEAEVVAVLRERFPHQEGAIDNVLERFVAAHLLRRFGDPKSPSLEVAHEALLRHWPYISRKLLGGEIKETLHRIKLVSRDAAEWARKGKAAGLLNLRGEHLQRARELAADGWLADAESKEYVSRCEELAEKRRQDAEAAKQYRLDQLEAERRKAEARADRIRFFARMGGGGLIVLFALFVAGLLLWQQSREATANVTAFASIAKSLQPAEALDLALTLVNSGADEAVLPLAHALDRMGHTWQLRNMRETAVHLNDDASVAFSFEYPQPAPADGKPSTKTKAVPIAIHFSLIEGMFDHPARSVMLPGARVSIGLGRLSNVSVGPVSKNGHNLVLLFFEPVNQNGHDAGSRMLAYRIDRLQKSITALDLSFGEDALDALKGIKEPPRPSFTADGEAVVFSIVNRASDAVPNELKSRVIELRKNGNSGLLVRMRGDAAHGNAPPIAVAYKGGKEQNSLVSLHSDARINCGDTFVSGTENSTGGHSTSGNVVTGAETSIVAVQYESGAVWYADCDNPREPAHEIRTTRPRPGTLALTVMSEDVVGGVDRGTPDNAGKRPVILSYLGGDVMQCWQLGSGEPAWHDCSPYHRISSGVLTAQGFQVISESAENSLLQRIANKGMFASDSGRVVLGQASSTGALLRVWPQGQGGDSKPKFAWDNGSGAHLEREFQHSFVDAGLSPAGNRVAWIELSNDGVSVHSCLELGDRQPSCDDDYVAPVINVPQVISIDDKGGIALLAFENSSGGGRSVTMQLGGERSVKWEDGFGGTNRVRCFRFSSNGEWVVAGQQHGLVRTRVRSIVDPLKPEVLIDSRSISEIDAENASLVNCDIDDLGQVVAGFQDGSVLLYSAGKQRPDGGKELREILTQRVYHSLPAGVQTVAFRQWEGRNYVIAIGQMQRTGCTRTGLPGQGIRIWELADNGRYSKDRQILVSNTCIPNLELTAIGKLEPDMRAELGVWLHDRNGRSIFQPCPGCFASMDETPEMRKQRLIKRANEKFAKGLKEDQLRTRYGLLGFGK
ncbi:MAG: hypothetical protein KDJ47_18875 [Hyphomicrobiaceae bacterium]|nr:hypothetical protein [Hyphomicrobiaceae bacterium]